MIEQFRSRSVFSLPGTSKLVESARMIYRATGVLESFDSTTSKAATSFECLDFGASLRSEFRVDECEFRSVKFHRYYSYAMDKRGRWKRVDYRPR